MGGELRKILTDGNRELVSECLYLVSWKRVGQLGQEKWWLNFDGWWAEREWDKWDKRYDLENLKIPTQFQMEKLTVIGTLVDLGLDEILKTMWWSGHEGLQFHLLFAKSNRESSSAITVMLIEQTNLTTKFFSNFAKIFLILCSQLDIISVLLFFWYCACTWRADS